MNLETYLETAKLLNLQRGQLEEGFRASMGLWFEKEGELVDGDASMKIEPPPVTEDLSRFFRRGRVRTDAERAQSALRTCKPATRPVYESFAARLMTVAKLSEVTGIQAIVISHAIANHYVSLKTFEALWPLFTPHERKLLKWPELLSGGPAWHQARRKAAA